MKKFIWVALAATCLFGSSIMLPEVGVSFAQAQTSSQCSFIQNADRRNMCRARAENQVSHCSFIQNADLRNLCRAQVAGDSSQCGFIKDADMRNECRASS